MKVISWNVNGIRSVKNKGFGEWFSKTKPDILCLQEIKAQKDSYPKELLELKGYFSYFNFAKKPGYSGVAVYTKEKPETIKDKLGFRRFDEEGRVLILEYPDFVLINIYLPHGGRDKSKLNYKLDCYKKLLDYLKQLKDKKVILIGDLNIAHTELDLARPKANIKNIMFTPAERAQIAKIISLGFIDSFRKFNKEGGNFTWWPYFANARRRNLGWRIDYAFVSKKLSFRLKNASILNKVKGSDHCPIMVEVK